MIGASTLGLVADSYFVLSAEQATGASFRAGPATAGPWADHLQHGGPPNALAVALAERTIRQATGRSDLTALRIAAEFVGPVPVGDLDLEARVLRSARSAALVEVTVASGGRDCLHARVWFVRDADTGTVAPALAAARPVTGESGPLELDFGYDRSLEWRMVSGRMGKPGPASAWVRPTLPLFAGYEYSGLARTVLIADSASGISAELDWSTWSFVNVDLDVHLARPALGDWVLMEATTQLGPRGSALARSTLSDVHGVVGAGLQTLVLAPIPTR